MDDNGVIGHIGRAQENGAEQTEEDNDVGLPAGVIDPANSEDFDNCPAVYAFTVVLCEDGNFRILPTTGRLEDGGFVCGAAVKTIRETSPSDILTGCLAVAESVRGKLQAAEVISMMHQAAIQNAKSQKVPPAVVPARGVPQGTPFTPNPGN